MAIPKSTYYAAIVNGRVAFIGSKAECSKRSKDVRLTGSMKLGQKAPADTGPTTEQIMASIRQIMKAA